MKCLDSYNAACFKLLWAEETSDLEMHLDDDAGRSQSRRKKQRALPLPEDESSPQKIPVKAKVEVQRKAQRALLSMPPVPPASSVG